MLGGMFSSAGAPDILGPNGMNANPQIAAATDFSASNQENS